MPPAKQHRKPGVPKPGVPKKTKTPQELPSALFGELLNTIAVSKAEHEESVNQRHLECRSWQMFALLVGDVIRLPDFDKVDPQAVIEEAEWLQGVIGSIARAFTQMGLLEDNEF